jgi:Fic family protein
LIEGHKTLPKDLERALQDDFSDNADKRANQHLAKAHIAVEQQMRARMEQEPDLKIQGESFIRWLHQEFYSRLPEELHYGERRDGSRYKIAMGSLRNFEVTVGQHQPPHHGSLSDFMQRFEQFYSSDRILPTNQLIALAAAHHRLAWIHPFGDGNGRVARLHTQAWLIRCKADGAGLWTISRGLARQKDKYYEYLQTADRGRLNDYDGRGNLSDKGLAEFCLFFMHCMLDQIDFMGSLLELPTLSARMESHLHITYPEWSLNDRERVARMLKAALIDGEIDRTTATRAAGVSPATGSKLIRIALEAGLLSTPSPKGALSVVFNSNVLDSYFPKLYQDLPA